MSPIKVAIYSRVSTAHQDDEGQYEELLALCQRSNWTVVHTYREKISGTKGPDQRLQLKQLLLAAKQRRFQKVVVWTVDRLGRSMRHLINTLGELHDVGIEVYSYRQGIDTSSPMGTALWSMLGIFSEMENNLRRERQALGIAKAKARGVRFGRHPPISDDTRREIVRLRKKKMGINKIARTLKCGTTSVYRALMAEGLPPSL